VRAIRVPLTDEQRDVIRRASGAEVREVIFAAPVDHDRPLVNELTADSDRELARILWENTGDFFKRAEDHPEVKAAFEEYVGHVLDPQWPVSILFR
jgi:hypothetical protein